MSLFNPNKALPGETLFITVPKLSDEVVLVPGSLAVIFDLTVSGQANNFLVNNVSRALVDRLTVKFAGEILQDTDGYDLFKLYEDSFLTEKERANRLSERIQSQDLAKIRCNAGDKKNFRSWKRKKAQWHLWKQVQNSDRSWNSEKSWCLFSKSFIRWIGFRTQALSCK